MPPWPTGADRGPVPVYLPRHHGRPDQEVSFLAPFAAADQNIEMLKVTATTAFSFHLFFKSLSYCLFAC